MRDLVAKVQPNDPYIRQVRVGQNRPNVVRIVLDLKGHVNPQVFNLAPVGEYRYRLVFDLYPDQIDDPLLAFLEKPDGEILFKRDGPPEFVPDTRTDPASKSLLKPRRPRDDAAPPTRAADAPTAATRSRRSRPAVARIITIALDPGHGGEDPGAVGAGGSHEKDVVLEIAKRVRRKLDAEPNMRVLMTRDADFFVPLERARAEGAARAGRPVRVDPRRRVRVARRARLVGVRAVRDAARRRRPRSGSRTRRTRPT